MSEWLVLGVVGLLLPRGEAGNHKNANMKNRGKQP